MWLCQNAIQIQNYQHQCRKPRSPTKSRSGDKQHKKWGRYPLSNGQWANEPVCEYFHFIIDTVAVFLNGRSWQSLKSVHWLLILQRDDDLYQRPVSQISKQQQQQSNGCRDWHQTLERKKQRTHFGPTTERRLKAVILWALYPVNDDDDAWHHRLKRTTWRGNGLKPREPRNMNWGLMSFLLFQLWPHLILPLGYELMVDWWGSTWPKGFPPLGGREIQFRALRLDYGKRSCMATINT